MKFCGCSACKLSYLRAKTIVNCVTSVDFFCSVALVSLVVIVNKLCVYFFPHAKDDGATISFFFGINICIYQSDYFDKIFKTQSCDWWKQFFGFGIVSKQPTDALGKYEGCSSSLKLSF